MYLPEAAQLQGIEFVDGWDNDIIYVSTPDGQHYTLASAGADDKLDPNTSLLTPVGRHIANYAEDLLFHDGSFYHWWAGWCCNTQYQERSLEELEQRLHSDSL